jgi:hypothetical protein
MDAHRSSYSDFNFKVTFEYCATIIPTVDPIWLKTEWPGQSPDINHIKKLRSILKEEVFELPIIAKQ